MLNVIYTHRKKARAMQMIQREKTESERKKAFEHTAESESDTRGLIINTSAEM